MGDVDRSDSIPSYAELPELHGARLAWDVWRDPRLGALELLTPERVRAAASVIERGAVFPLDAALDELDPPLFKRVPVRHELRTVVGEPHEPVGMADTVEFNTQLTSQWDGFRHIADVGSRWFGGLDSDEHGVDHWARVGIVGRGVLIDLARWRSTTGQPPLPLGESEAVTADDLAEALHAQGTVIKPGDVLMLRTGWLGGYRKLDRRSRVDLAERGAFPGLANDETMTAMLWDLHPSAVVADNPALEAWPYDESRPTDCQHVRLLPRLGIPIGELWSLDALAEDCASRGSYACLLVSAPLHLRGGVGSPANAVAIR